MSDVHFDFAFILTALTLVTGVVWAADRFWLAKRRGEAKPGMVVDFCCSFFPVIALVLGLRTCLTEPFRIPSGSMIPTLQVGDFILVNKFAFGVRDPVFHYKLLKIGEPQRGDIVVFRWPVDPTKDFIKRIVGVPGDHISYRDKVLYINGEKAAQSDQAVFDVGAYGSILRYREDLGGVAHDIHVYAERPSDDFDVTVGEGEYFAMGDNRDGSDDSRRWGMVPEKNLVGRAYLIWLNLILDWDGIKPNFQMDFSRIGTRLH
ncbi:MAG TPA: signal peptidase I [Nevskiaceae bacterium]|nr:signal peptidase I [Nevskiaceae bacterium]